MNEEEKEEDSINSFEIKQQLYSKRNKNLIESDEQIKKQKNQIQNQEIQIQNQPCSQFEIINDEMKINSNILELQCDFSDKDCDEEMDQINKIPYQNLYDFGNKNLQLFNQQDYQNIIIERYVFVYPEQKLYIDKQSGSDIPLYSQQPQIQDEIQEGLLKNSQQQQIQQNIPKEIDISIISGQINQFNNNKKKQSQNKNTQQEIKMKCPISFDSQNYSDLTQQNKFFQTNGMQKIEQILQNSLFSTSILNNLINDLLDLAKIEQNTFKFENEYFDLLECIEDLFGQFKNQLIQKNISIKYEINNLIEQHNEEKNIYEKNSMNYEKSIFMNILGDKRRYLQIITNFISNSLKFTNDNGTITLYISLLEQQDESNSQLKLSKQKIELIDNNSNQSQDLESINQNEQKKQQIKGPIFKQQKIQNDIIKYQIQKQRKISVQFNDSKQFKQIQQFQQNIVKFIKIRIQIVDSGVGIKKENLSKLFMDFSKLDEHSKINTQGTGLGLSICKRIIEQMGGTVSVDSKLGVGTTFTIDLQTKTKILNPMYFKIQNNININNFSQEIFINNERKSSNYIFKNQKSIGFISANDPNNLNNQNKMIRNSNEYIVENNNNQILKQNNPSHYNIISDLYDSDVHQDQQLEQVKYVCLVANDDSFQRIMIEHILKQCGVQILLIAQNGQQAFQYIKENFDKKIDFILLDLEMPIMNGFESCKNICNIYNNENKIFGKQYQNLKINIGDRQVHNPKSDRRKSLPLEQNQSSDLINILNEMKYKPLLVAYSSFINEKIIKDAGDVGFEIILEGPLTQRKIKDQIFSRLISNQNFQNINNNLFNKGNNSYLNEIKIMKNDQIQLQSIISLQRINKNEVSNYSSSNIDGNKIEEIAECEEQSIKIFKMYD